MARARRPSASAPAKSCRDAAREPRPPSAAKFLGIECQRLGQQRVGLRVPGRIAILAHLLQLGQGEVRVRLGIVRLRPQRRRVVVHQLAGGHAGRQHGRHRGRRRHRLPDHGRVGLGGAHAPAADEHQRRQQRSDKCDGNRGGNAPEGECHDGLRVCRWPGIAPRPPCGRSIRVRTCGPRPRLPSGRCPGTGTSSRSSRRSC